jgi:hypothetical protein
LSFPPPERGSVIRYGYLWADESTAGQEEGRKDRPVLVLALSVKEQFGTTQLLVLAITHTPRADPDGAISLPRAVKRRIGLDDAPAWIVTTEANAFTWPGPDIRPIPGRGRGRSCTGACQTPCSGRSRAPFSPIASASEVGWWRAPSSRICARIGCDSCATPLLKDISFNLF